MKLGSLKHPTLRDGELVVVSRDNLLAVRATDITPNLRSAIENWGDVQEPLSQRYEQLNQGECDQAFTVNEKDFHSPLPRAVGWMDGSAYIQHVRLVRQARNAAPPETLMTVPLMYQGGSDVFLAPDEDIPQTDFSHGTDFEGEVGVIVDDVPLGVSAENALNYVRLIVIINDVSLRGLIPAELKQGFGFLQSKPSSAFAPFAITPDELGDAWRDGRVHLPLLVHYNETQFGHADAGHMHFSFADLIAHAARTRRLAAGTIIGSGTVSNEDTAKGSSCLAEKRMLEIIHEGAAKTPFMKVGDRIRIEMKEPSGQSLFGAINQKVVGVKPHA